MKPKKAAKDAVSRVPLPPRPQQLGMASTGAPAPPPKPSAIDPFEQRALCWYRDTDRVVMGVVWREKDARDRVVFHILNTANNGSVEHRILPASEAKYITDARVLATAQDFETYLRGRLEKYGGTRSAYKVLNVEPPAQTMESATDEAADRLAELYSRAARLLGVPEPELRKKYGHLNPGLQRMNLGNRLRAKGHNV